MSDVFDAHPRPWRLGESKTSTTEVIDANNRRVATVWHGGIVGGHRETPQVIIDAVNAVRVPSTTGTCTDWGRP